MTGDQGRVDPRVTAGLKYVSEHEMPGMLHAALIRSPHASARIIRVDTSALPADTRAVFAADLGELADRLYGAAIRDEPVLPRNYAKYVGEPIGAVVADSDARARELAALVRVEYEVLPPVLDVHEAMREDSPLVHPDLHLTESSATSVNVKLRPTPQSNACHTFSVRQGESAWESAADVIVEKRVRIAGAAHVPMEPHVTIASWNDGRPHLITGTQTPFAIREGLAELFDVPEGDIRIEVPPMGGSFGAKTFLRLEPIALALSRLIGKPIRMALNRVEEFQTLNRHPAEFHVRLGATTTGELVGKTITAWWDSGAYADAGPDVATKGGYASIGPYRIPHVVLDSHCIYTNTTPNGAYRGYAATQATWASERCMDELAIALNMDPVELRLKNVLQQGETFATGEVLHDMHVEECLRACADAIDWEPGRPGVGIALVMKGMHTPSRAEAALEIGGDGKIWVLSATTEFGQRVDLVQRQLAARSMEAPLSIFAHGPNDTDRVPFDARTTSSRSVHMMSHALHEAATDLRRKIADKIGSGPEELSFTDEGVQAGESLYALADFAGLRGDGRFVTSGGLEPHFGQGIASSDWHQGAAAAVVDVDEETGLITIQRLHTAAWAGKVVERRGAELQTEGCMIMGVGSTLFEQLSWDEFGLPQQTTLSDYNVPSILDVPKLEYTLLEGPGDGSSSELKGAHGLGETALPPIPAAVGNGLLTLGYDINDLPMTPEVVLNSRLSAGIADERSTTS